MGSRIREKARKYAGYRRLVSLPEAGIRTDIPVFCEKSLAFF